MGRSLLSVTFFCKRCRKNTKFLPVQFACALASVSRSTLYYWMDHAWIHWLERPNGRRLICQQGLQHLRDAPDVMPSRLSRAANLSETVRHRPKA
jgi:hypothetical protein